MANTMMLKYAAKKHRELLARQEEYQRECEYWYSQGYRPHYCIHGVNMWVDWDCVCGYCEESLQPLEEALILARGWYHTYQKMMEVTSMVRKTGLFSDKVDDALFNEWIEWGLQAYSDEEVANYREKRKRFA